MLLLLVPLEILDDVVINCHITSMEQYSKNAKAGKRASQVWIPTKADVAAKDGARFLTDAAQLLKCIFSRVFNLQVHH
jgi:hypothetical protein